MKSKFCLLLFALLLAFTFPAPAQTGAITINPSSNESVTLNSDTQLTYVTQSGDTIKGPFVDLLEELFNFDIPDTFNPANPNDFVTWFLALSIPLVPIILFIISKAAPGMSRKDLVARAVVGGAAVIVGIIAMKGEFNSMYLFQGIIALVGQIGFYANVMKPAGFASAKSATYKRE